jgi:hypothetical protein
MSGYDSGPRPTPEEVTAEYLTNLEQEIARTVILGLINEESFKTIANDRIVEQMNDTVFGLINKPEEDTTQAKPENETSSYTLPSGRTIDFKTLFQSGNAETPPSTNGHRIEAVEELPVLAIPAESFHNGATTNGYGENEPPADFTLETGRRRGTNRELSARRTQRLQTALTEGITGKKNLVDIVFAGDNYDLTNPDDIKRAGYILSYLKSDLNNNREDKGAAEKPQGEPADDTAVKVNEPHAQNNPLPSVDENGTENAEAKEERDILDYSEEELTVLYQLLLNGLDKSGFETAIERAKLVRSEVELFYPHFGRNLKLYEDLITSLGSDEGRKLAMSIYDRAVDLVDIDANYEKFKDRYEELPFQAQCVLRIYHHIRKDSHLLKNFRPFSGIHH